jgi:hypothetical protein
MLHDATLQWKVAWKDADPVGRLMVLYILVLVPAMLIGSIIWIALV